LSTRALWQSYKHNHLVAKQERLAKECLTKYLFHTSKSSLTCRKILRHGAPDFSSPPKEVVLRIFIALKIHSPLQGLNPQTLGPITSTLTTRSGLSKLRPAVHYHAAPRTSLNKCLKINFKKSVEMTHSRRNTFRSFFVFVCEKLCSWFYFSVC
jgi:hypothetical protein